METDGLPSDYYSKPIPDPNQVEPIGFKNDPITLAMRARGVVFEIDRSDLKANSIVDIDEITRYHAEGWFEREYLNMRVRAAYDDPNNPIVYYENFEVVDSLYGTIVADRPIQALLCRLIDQDMLEIEGPYEDGSVLLYGRGLFLRDYIEGAVLMQQVQQEAAECGWYPRRECGRSFDD